MFLFFFASLLSTCPVGWIQVNTWRKNESNAENNRPLFLCTPRKKDILELNVIPAVWHHLGPGNFRLSTQTGSMHHTLLPRAGDMIFIWDWDDQSNGSCFGEILACRSLASSHQSESKYFQWCETSRKVNVHSWVPRGKIKAENTWRMMNKRSPLSLAIKWSPLATFFFHELKWWRQGDPLS